MSEPLPGRPLLRALEPLYRLGLALRERQLQARQPKRLSWPVVSIGNLSTGGSGKTPLAIALAQALIRRGVHVDVLSRGYGRKTRATLQVDPNGIAEDYGDEPLLIARETGIPVYVAAQRYQAGLRAEQGYEAGRGNPPSPPQALHLLDDGFQHRQLHRDIDILVVTASDLADRLLPAGNLREALRALHRASVIAIPAGDPALEAALEVRGWTGPLWRLHRSMDVPAIDGPVVAFCGIARPGQFFSGLAAARLKIASRIAFRDHHRYISHDIDCLIDAARSVSAAAIVTTGKDRVRLGALAASIPPSIALHTAALTTVIDDEKAAVDWLLAGLQVVRAVSA